MRPQPGCGKAVAGIEVPRRTIRDRNLQKYRPHPQHRGRVVASRNNAPPIPCLAAAGMTARVRTSASSAAVRSRMQAAGRMQQPDDVRQRQLQAEHVRLQASAPAKAAAWMAAMTSQSAGVAIRGMRVRPPARPRHSLSPSLAFGNLASRRIDIQRFGAPAGESCRGNAAPPPLRCAGRSADAHR